MVSRAEDPDAWSLAVAMPTSWVQFMLEDPVAEACLATTGRRYPEHQFALLDGDRAVGKVRSVPLPWDRGRADLPAHGWDAVLVEAADADERPVTGVASLLEATVRPDLRTPMVDYVARVREDGLPTDPWLRTHARLGATVVQVCPASMTIPGTIDEWEAWTGTRFTASGRATVPGALTRVHVDVEADHAVYVEPNVWVRHDLSAS